MPKKRLTLKTAASPPFGGEGRDASLRASGDVWDDGMHNGGGIVTANGNSGWLSINPVRCAVSCSNPAPRPRTSGRPGC